VQQLDIELQGGFKAASEVRHLLADLKPHVSQQVYDDLVFMINELVTNSVRHARIGASGKIVLSVQADPKLVRAEVRDDGPGFDESVRRDPGLDEGSGWGLYLIEKMADRWGVTRHKGGGTSVWFEMEDPGAVRGPTPTNTASSET
jgi:anti-sigma regulatory factor (Ser/Thr protein kinase)